MNERRLAETCEIAGLALLLAGTALQAVKHAWAEYACFAALGVFGVGTAFRVLQVAREDWPRKRLEAALNVGLQAHVALAFLSAVATVRLWGEMYAMLFSSFRLLFVVVAVNVVNLQFVQKGEFAYKQSYAMVSPFFSRSVLALLLTMLIYFADPLQLVEWFSPDPAADRQRLLEAFREIGWF